MERSGLFSCEFAGLKSAFFAFKFAFSLLCCLVYLAICLTCEGNLTKTLVLSDGVFISEVIIRGSCYYIGRNFYLFFFQAN